MKQKTAQRFLLSTIPTVSLVAIYWLIVNALLSFVFKQGDFVHLIYHPSSQQLIIALLSMLFIAVTSFIMHWGSFIYRERCNAMAEHGRFIEAVVKNSSDGIAVINSLNHSLVYISPAMQKIFGYDFDEITSADQWIERMAVDQSEKEALYKNLQADCQATAPPERFRRIKRKDGEIRWCRFQFSRLDKELIIIAGQDVTDQKKNEALLNEQRTFLANVFSSIQDGISILDSNLTITSVNPTMEKWYHHAMPLVGKKCHEAFHLSTTPCTSCPSLKTLHNGKASYEVVPKRGTDGMIVGWLDLYSFPLIDSTTGDYKGVIEYVRDISSRKIAEDALINEKERLDVTLRSIADAVISTDATDSITLMNRQAELLTGWLSSEAIGKPYYDVFRTNTNSNSVKTTTPTRLFETTLYKKDNSRCLVAHTNAPMYDRNNQLIGTVVVFRDITHQRQSEEEIQKAQRIDSIGLLASGIAHDFNNILTAILANISLARLDTPRTDPRYESLSDAEKATFRARGLTQQLLTFSKGGQPVKQIMALPDFLTETVQFALRGSNVRSTFDIPSALWLTPIDEGQISQAINNLVINADQAMPHGGTLAIRAENITVPDQESIPTDAGIYVKISIIDQGIGIPPEYLSKIFDPYFTTKQKGNGLGLTSTYSIIKKHGGYISATSTPGTGSAFYIYLPATTEAAISPIDLWSSPALKGQGRILLMDDDDAILSVTSKLLSHIGYQVDIARHGAEMLSIFQAAALGNTPYDAVILDLTIPGAMGGKEAVDLLKKQYPQALAIVSSGYSNDPVLSDFSAYGFSGAIRKPYEISELHSVIVHVLSERTNEQ